MSSVDVESRGTQARVLAQTARALAALTASLGSQRFGARMLDFLRSQNDFDSAMVLCYHPRQRPLLLAEALAHPLRRNSADTYLNGAYLLDPVFVRASATREPELVRLSEIAPGDFPDSEYVRSYYKDSNIVDEVNYLVPGKGRLVFAVCLGRSRSKRPFTGPEFARFQAWLPVLVSMFRQHERQGEAGCALPVDDAVDHEHDRLQGLLSGFGRDRLTRREHEIAQLLLRGRSTPRIASELKVSAQTVRVHRRNIYDKLDVSSLGELFSLAMYALVGARR